MTKQFAQFTGSIPENYEKGLVPHIFLDYGKDLADRIATLNPRKLLEIAAGTGIVTCMLRDVLDNKTHITATDLNSEMLEVAQQKLDKADNIELKPADATALPFEDEAFGVVVCQFGVMFFPDKDSSYREVYRTLSPGGKYVFNVWDSFENNHFARIAHETIATFFPDEPPEFLRLPFGYNQIDEIKDSLVDAGFNNITSEILQRNKEIPDAEVFARGLVCGNPTAEEIKERGNADPEEVVLALSKALRNEFGNDPGQMTMQAILFTASKST